MLLQNWNTYGRGEAQVHRRQFASCTDGRKGQNSILNGTVSSSLDIKHPAATISHLRSVQVRPFVCPCHEDLSHARSYNTLHI